MHTFRPPTPSKIGFFILLAFLLAHFPALAETLEGRVVGVHDGDTVTLLVGGNQPVKIRLSQVDAPESDQAFGQKSKQSLSELVFGKDVKVETETIDKYGRTVGTIFVDGIDANREQVKRGMAWAYRKYLTDQSLLQDEAAAKQAKIGLWADANPMPPWEYRHGGKYGHAEGSSQPQAGNTPLVSNPACGGKRYCKQMASCDEARFYLTQCGVTSLDRDGDGTPCESLCNPRH